MFSGTHTNRHHHHHRHRHRERAAIRDCELIRVAQKSSYTPAHNTPPIFQMVQQHTPQKEGRERENNDRYIVILR